MSSTEESYRRNIKKSIADYREQLAEVQAGHPPSEGFHRETYNRLGRDRYIEFAETRLAYWVMMLIKRQEEHKL